MKVNISLLIASIVLVTACNKSDDSKPKAATPAPAPIAESLSDKDGNCTATAEAALVSASESLDAYDKDPSAEKLAVAGSKCDKLQTLVGDKSCLMKNADPQVQLNKDVLGQACSSVTEKIKLAAEEAARPEITPDQILNEKFVTTKNSILVNAVETKDAKLTVTFKMGAKIDAGLPFEADLGCSYFSQTQFSSISHSTSTAYNNEKTVIKDNGDVVRLCGSEEIKVGQKTKNGFSFKAGYCGGLKDKVENAHVEVKILSADKIHVDVKMSGSNKMACSAELNKEVKK